MRIVIVEDDEDQVRRLKDFIRRFEGESGEKCFVETFGNGMDFISDYSAKYDLVLLDIEMPHMDGMSAAEKLRETDEYTAIIFVTNMAQYAVRGYSVDALDFIVKPVEYAVFSAKLRKALAYVKSHEDRHIFVTTQDGMRKLYARDIRFVEVMGHYLAFHLAKEKVTVRGQLEKIEKALPPESFIRCNKCYLINLDHVTGMTRETVRMDDDELTVSRRRRKEFFARLADHIGGGVTECFGTSLPPFSPFSATIPCRYSRELCFSACT